MKVDVDACPETTELAMVKCMPTFKVLKNGKEIASVLGAKESELKEMLAKHCA
jgi:thioredoxin-like negative regulator of GroEL